MCFVEAANTHAPSHTRTAQVIVTEYNRRFQQVRIFDKFTEADPSADIHFSWLSVGEAIRWVDRNTKETVKQSCWDF